MAALVCVLSPIAIKTELITFSLGTLAVYVVGGVVDWKHGMAALGVFLALGVCGLPIFTGYTNLYQCIGGPTFGYVIGYIPCALIIGIMTDIIKKRRYIWCPVAIILGTLVMYAVGTVWFCYITSMDFITALMYCVVPYLLLDGIKIAVASAVICILKPRLQIKKETAKRSQTESSIVE